MQSAKGQQLLRENGLNPADPISFLLVDESGGHSDTEAIICILNRFGGLWKLTSMLRVIPVFIRDAAYRWIARNRYRWFGRRETCIVPSAELVDRFLQ